MADEAKKYLDYDGLKHLVEKLTDRIEAAGGGEEKLILFIRPNLSFASVTIGGESRRSARTEAGGRLSWSVSADGYITRSGTETLTEDTILDVTLHEDAPHLTLDPTSLVVGAQGGRREVPLDSSSGCQATATASWITGIDCGDDVLSFDVAANTSGDLRTDTVTVTNEDGLSASLLVVQEGE